ncbi:uncharacterized protein LOC106131350 [Amyelois transitella]|uniref:uncharacterized protein LOC106131350 n=1 Tax=Amyelois transitella TaxID=680683 RepID=UPI00298F8901|nr:uncharacterized protein LOC106131350 [Amyelois transitella]
MEKVTLLVLFVALGFCNCADTNTCTSDGRFITDSYCTSYTVCVKQATSFVTYTIPCPKGLSLNLNLVCSITGAKCLPSYSCTSLGNFSDSTSARNYISCTQGLGDLKIAISMECPKSTEFNAASGICEENLTPITTTDSQPSIETTVPSTLSPINELSGATLKPSAETTTILPILPFNPRNPINELSDDTLRVIPPIFTTTTQKITPRAANNSVNNVASYIIVLAILFCNMFTHRVEA